MVTDMTDTWEAIVGAYHIHNHRECGQRQLYRHACPGGNDSILHSPRVESTLQDIVQYVHFQELKYMSVGLGRRECLVQKKEAGP